MKKKRFDGFQNVPIRRFSNRFEGYVFDGYVSTATVLTATFDGYVSTCTVFDRHGLTATFRRRLFDGDPLAVTFRRLRLVGHDDFEGLVDCGCTVGLDEHVGGLSDAFRRRGVRVDRPRQLPHGYVVLGG